MRKSSYSLFSFSLELFPVLHYLLFFQFDPNNIIEDNTNFGSFLKINYVLDNNQTLVQGLEIHQLTCHVYHMLLKHLPAMVSTYIKLNLLNDKIHNVNLFRFVLGTIYQTKKWPEL